MPHAAVAHRLANRGLHAVQFLGRGLAPCGAHDPSSHRAVAHQVGDVRARAVGVHVSEKLGDVSGPAAVAGDHRRAALHQVVQARPDSGLGEGSVGVGVRVDQPRSHDHPRAIDGASDLARHQLADGHDPSIADCHVARGPLGPASVVDHAAAQQHIRVDGGRPRGCCQHRQAQQQERGEHLCANFAGMPRMSLCGSVCRCHLLIPPRSGSSSGMSSIHRVPRIRLRTIGSAAVLRYAQEPHKGRVPDC